jgi:hypothetical protein
MEPLALARDLRTAEQLLRAMERHGWSLVDVHPMDEFTNDWVVAAGEVWLVFDTT